jgi:hypothetical protein
VAGTAKFHSDRVWGLRGEVFSSLGRDGSLFSAGVRLGGCPTSPYCSVRLWIVSCRELGQKFLRDRLEFLVSSALYCSFHFIILK